MTTGVILAGGRGSRLGPLAAQISKALVSIGQRPHIIHQIELLRRNGVEQIVVVTSPDTDRQVQRVLERAGQTDVTTTIQARPLGPVDAIASGLEEVRDRKADLLVLMADTYLPLSTNLRITGTWAGVAPAPARRSFCMWDSDAFTDRTADVGEEVTIGAYRFQGPSYVWGTARDVVWDANPDVNLDVNPEFGIEVGMALFLTAMEPVALEIDGWMDIGDMASLARARRTRFIARAEHGLTLSNEGTLSKEGVSLRQIGRMEELDNDIRTSSLVPTVYNRGNDWVEMDYIDLPTLAELWLYWPGEPELWREVVESVIARLERQLWKPIYDDPYRERVFFIDKAIARTTDPEIHELVHEVTPLFKGSPNVTGHGDLNFNNILYSMNTGSFKLVDPRGNVIVPLSYEYAKLAYSWNGFAEITHHLDLNRYYERMEMNKAIPMEPQKLLAAMGCLLVAGAALHDEEEAAEMLDRGAALLRKAAR